MEVAQTARLADWRVRHQSSLDEARYNVRVFFKDKLAVAGLVIILFTITVAFIGPWIAPYPAQGRGDSNLKERLQAPSAEHLLGTDNYGRDILSRVIYGARIPLLISFVTTAAIVLIGVPIGGIAGYFGGRFDEVVMRICDVFLAFPSLILAIVFVAFLGPSIRNAMIAIVLSWWPWYTRLVRGMAVSLRERPYIEAAKTMGVGDFTIIARHILPNSFGPVIVQMTLDIGTVILAAAGLSFIGLGAQPPVAEWGLMISEGRDYILDQWWIGAFAGLAILILVLAFNLVGDGLRDVLDPAVEEVGGVDELLRVRGLKLQFRSMRGIVKALDGVDISVHDREILGLVGESGCGKTITGLAILGLLQKPQAEITGGEISYRGQDLLAKSDKEMQDLRGREISMVFQDPLASLNPVFQVGHQIEDVVRIHKGVSRKESRETTLRALAEVGLPASDETLKRYPHQFSGGMRQRVCMAMALACGSPLLIADEPTTALDVTIQAQILNLLLRLREELGVAQVIITHNVGVAAQTCDRIAVMYAGSVVEEGPVVEVLSRPRHPYTIALYQCLPHGHTASELRTIPGTVPDLIAPPTGCRFHPRCAHVLEVCPSVKPQPVQVGDRHWVSCFWATGEEAVAAGSEAAL